MITESQLEQLALSWFQVIGWAHASGPDIAPDGPAPESTSYYAVMLRDSPPMLKCKYPPKGQEDAIDAVLNQARVLVEE